MRHRAEKNEAKHAAAGKIGHAKAADVQWEMNLQASGCRAQAYRSGVGSCMRELQGQYGEGQKRAARDVGWLQPAEPFWSRAVN
jgi:hypothetical protein